MKNQKPEMETGWHIMWSLPMPENRALAGKRQGTGALPDAPRTREPWCSRQRLGVRRPSAALKKRRKKICCFFPVAALCLCRHFETGMTT